MPSQNCAPAVQVHHSYTYPQRDGHVARREASVKLPRTVAFVAIQASSEGG
jgi:hypothetical protein